LSERRVFDPRAGHDHVRGGKPVAVLVKTGIEAISVVDIDDRRELNLSVGGKFHAAQIDAYHLFLRFDLNVAVCLCSRRSRVRKRYSLKYSSGSAGATFPKKFRRDFRPGEIHFKVVELT
jgi:hypothetical protein